VKELKVISVLALLIMSLLVMEIKRNENSLKVGDISFLIFDESDQMFDTGFYDDCVYIRSRVSSAAQIVLSSATITPRVEHFLRKSIKDFELVKIGTLIPPNIDQDVLFCPISDKTKLLVNFFQGEKFSRAIVFANTKVKLSSIYDTLLHNKITANYLSSDLDQKDREKVVRDFKAAKFSVLVSTDIASRGLDIQGVDIIVNYDVPPRSEFYVHRIGRCGRNDLRGYALTFICPEDEEDFSIIEHQFDLTVGVVNTNFELIDDE
jgi:superfamily II DNA/RNA helicase